MLTSRGIQRRFWTVLSERRSKIVYEEYWLLKPEECKGLVKVSLNSDVQPTNDDVQATNEDSSPIKKSKVNKSIYNTGFSPELERAFQMYLLVRKNNFGDIPDEQIQALRDDLLNLSDKEEERIAIVKKATASGWKSFYKTEKSSGTPKGKVKDNNNFERRKYDMDALERSLLGDGS